MLNKIINIDRRILFILLAVAVLILTILQPLLLVAVSEPTQKVYNYIEALPPSSTVMMSFDYGPSSMPEPTAIADAVLRHCFINCLHRLPLIHQSLVHWLRVVSHFITINYTTNSY